MPGFDVLVSGCVLTNPILSQATRWTKSPGSIDEDSGQRRALLFFRRERQIWRWAQERRVELEAMDRRAVGRLAARSVSAKIGSFRLRVRASPACRDVLAIVVAVDAGRWRRPQQFQGAPGQRRSL